MQSSEAGRATIQTWAINGRFLTQRVTGVHRYAREIVASLDSIVASERAAQGRPQMRLVLPPNVQEAPVLSSIEVHTTRFGSGHAWDQVVLPAYAKDGVLSL